MHMLLKCSYTLFYDQSNLRTIKSDVGFVNLLKYDHVKLKRL